MLQPIQTTERYKILDILRGFALLGVLLANMSTHSGYFFLSDSQKASLPTAGTDHAIMWVIHFLIDGKFYSLFSLLFGIGFAIQMKRSEDKSVKFAGRFSRRIFILFLIGLIHAVFFYVGDILTVYAITGIFLLFFRRVTNSFLLRSVLVFILLPIIQYAIFWSMAIMNPAPPPPPADPAAPRFFDMLVLQYQTGSYMDIVKNNIGGLLYGRWPDLIFTGRLFRVMAMFLLGFYVTRKMIFANLAANRLLLKKVTLWGAIIGIPFNIILALMMETNAYYGFEAMGIIQPIVYGFGVPALSLFYTAAICLAYEKYKGKGFLDIFSPVGQMALTNYLMQSIICCVIFMSYGFGWFGKIGPLYLSCIGLIIFTFQVLFSHWWLTLFRFGPMEWLWRSATYGKWQPMKK